MLLDIRAVVASTQRVTKIPFIWNQIRFFRRTDFIETRCPDEWSLLSKKNVSEAVKMALNAKIKMSLVGNFKAKGSPVIKIRY